MALPLACSAGSMATFGADAGIEGGLPSDPTACVSQTMCPKGRSLGTIAGDDPDAGDAPVETQGSRSEWLLVDVREVVSAWSGQSLRVHVSLTNPPGTRFVVSAYAYTATIWPDGGDVPEDGGPGVDCTHSIGRSRVTELDLEWGEPSDGGSANGRDDSRIVALYVEHVSGPCSGAPWKLTVRRAL